MKLARFLCLVFLVGSFLPSCREDKSPKSLSSASPRRVTSGSESASKNGRISSDDDRPVRKEEELLPGNVAKLLDPRLTEDEKNSLRDSYKVAADAEGSSLGAVIARDLNKIDDMSKRRAAVLASLPMCQSSEELLGLHSSLESEKLRQLVAGHVIAKSGEAESIPMTAEFYEGLDFGGDKVMVFRALTSSEFKNFGLSSALKRLESAEFNEDLNAGLLALVERGTVFASEDKVVVEKLIGKLSARDQRKFRVLIDANAAK